MSVQKQNSGESAIDYYDISDEQLAEFYKELTKAKNILDKCKADKQKAKEAKASALDKAYEADRNKRLGIDRLTVERNIRPSYDVQNGKPASPSQLDIQFNERIKQKYKMSSLHLEGHEQTSRERTLEDTLIDTWHEQLGDKKLSFGSVQYNGKTQRLWYELSI